MLWPVILSTPSLGITPRSSTTWTSQAWLSTPSLGITGKQVPEGERAGYIASTFNSLSRDHRAQFRDFSALRGFLPRRLFAQMISEATIWIYRFAPL